MAIVGDAAWSLIAWSGETRETRWFAASGFQVTTFSLDHPELSATRNPATKEGIEQ